MIDQKRDGVLDTREITSCDDLVKSFSHPSINDSGGVSGGQAEIEGTRLSGSGVDLHGEHGCLGALS